MQARGRAEDDRGRSTKVSRSPTKPSWVAGTLRPSSSHCNGQSWSEGSKAGGKSKAQRSSSEGRASEPYGNGWEEKWWREVAQAARCLATQDKAKGRVCGELWSGLAWLPYGDDGGRIVPLNHLPRACLAQRLANKKSSIESNVDNLDEPLASPDLKAAALVSHNATASGTAAASQVPPRAASPRHPRAAQLLTQHFPAIAQRFPVLYAVRDLLKVQAPQRPARRQWDASAAARVRRPPGL
ncbi:hypothetical protein G7046_g7851 [Stylonectria norvegica]|nr:hypothetical protein G7046_g7851 [Stylonectria norvegica]